MFLPVSRFDLCVVTMVAFLVAFSSLARIWGECSTIHFPPALFFKVEISSRALIQDQFTMAQQAETTVA